jgi:uncharacterized protein YdeI (YjbR/CyaY-like superfamily)
MSADLTRSPERLSAPPDPTPSPDHLPVLQFADLAAWQRWLERHDSDSPGVWLKIAKQTSPTTTVTHPEALEVAICHGWIDGQRRAHDAEFFLQRFTPRGPRSKWSQINRQKATELIEAGRMRPSGQVQVDAAKADGRWDAAYEPQARASVPEDLQKALDQSHAAAEFFATLTGQRRYAFLYRLHHVKDPVRRAKRIADYIDLLSAGKTLN